MADPPIEELRLHAEASSTLGQQPLEGGPEGPHRPLEPLLLLPLFAAFALGGVSRRRWSRRARRRPASHFPANTPGLLHPQPSWPGNTGSRVSNRKLRGGAQVEGAEQLGVEGNDHGGQAHEHGTDGHGQHDPGPRQRASGQGDGR